VIMGKRDLQPKVISLIFEDLNWVSGSYISEECTAFTVEGQVDQERKHQKPLTP
jgi:hypothetical protein